MIYLNLGRREVGKTTLARYFAEQRSPRLILDPRSQWPTLGAIREPARGELLDRLEDGETIVVQPIELDRASEICADAVTDFLIATNDRSRELAIVIDESSLIADLGPWSYIFRGSPRDRTTIVLTTHRPQDVSTFVRAIADYWCVFRMTQEHDLEVVRKRCGEKVAAIVAGLDPFQFVSWNDAKGEYRIHRDGELWRAPRRELPTDQGSRLWRD